MSFLFVVSVRKSVHPSISLFIRTQSSTHHHPTHTTMSEFKVMTYNVLNLAETTDRVRFQAVVDVINRENPEVLGLQELISADAAKRLHEALGTDRYHLVFDESVSPSQDTALMYRKNSLFSDSATWKVLYTRQGGGNRNILQVTLTEANGGTDWHFFVAHLQASQGSSNRSERAYEAKKLRDLALDALIQSNARCVVLGDLNLYSHTEPA